MPIDWSRARADYEKNGAGFKELAEIYGCRPDTVRKKAVKEGWRQGPGGMGDGQDGADPHKRVLHGHRELWGSVKKKLRSGLSKGDEKELKLAKIAGDGLLNIVKGERQAWGLAGDELDAGPEEILGITKEMDEVTAPCRADEALDGE